jgi:small-conductance mechanosensitive channel
VIWVIAFLLILGTLDVNLAPFLASAGVARVALGFGAQSIVKDTLSGFFILLENQFGVGDVIEVQSTAGPVSGKVEDLSLRLQPFGRPTGRCTSSRTATSRWCPTKSR